MPLYELTLIVRAMGKVRDKNFALTNFLSLLTQFKLKKIVVNCQADLVNVMKRCTSSLLDSGGVIEKLDSLGCRDLPYRMVKEGNKHWVGK